MMNNQKLNEPLKQAIDWALANDKGLIKLGASVDDLTALYPYYDKDGKELFIKVRFDTDKGKWIKPFCLTGNKYRLGEPKLDKKPLYLPAPLGDVVYIVEGEKCVDVLIQLELSATTTGGATSVNKCDLSPLIGRDCMIWRDNDDSGTKWQMELINALNGLNIAHTVIDVDAIQLPTGASLPPKGDCVDFVQACYADGDDDLGIIKLIQALPTKDPQAQDPQASPIQISQTSNTPQDAQTLLDLDTQASQLQGAIGELACLDEIRLHLALPKVAKSFGISQKALMGFVADYKGGDLVKATTPHREPQAGEMVFNALYGLIDAYMVIDDCYKIAFVLWVIFSHLVEHSDIAPIAWITSPEKQCGKSTLFGLFARVVDRPFTANNITQAVLYRVMDKYKPCLLVDEIDTSLKDKGELLGIINAGYSRHASITPRINTDNGGAVDTFNAYGAKVFSGIGEMQGTFASRSIRFNLRRKHQGETAQRLTQKTLSHAKTDAVKSKVKRWANDNVDAILAVDIPLLPINDRDFDNWELLLKIASRLGIYDRAVNACLAICQIKGELSQGERLLADIRAIWNGGDKMGSGLLLDRLNALEEAEWQTLNNGQPMNAHQLAKRLKSFGIKSKPVRHNDAVFRGFDKADFVKVWERYLPPQPTEPYPF